MIGAIDNGFILYVGETYCSYFPYSTWRLAKHTQTSVGRLFDVLRDIVKYGGIAMAYKEAFREAAASISRSVKLDLSDGNQYFPIPDGSRIKLREGRHGSSWGLYEACLCAYRMCDLYPEKRLTAERVIPGECE